jgi:hypothetical protein
MFIPIPLPRGVSLRDAKRLRAHAEWYLREAARHGPGYGAKRFERQRRRRLRSTRVAAIATATLSSPSGRLRTSSAGRAACS